MHGRSTPGRKPKECGIVFGAGTSRGAISRDNPARSVRFTISLNDTPSVVACCRTNAAKSSSSVSVVRITSASWMPTILMSRHQLRVGVQRGQAAAGVAP